MCVEDFQYLLKLIYLKIEKKSNRALVPSAHRLALTLRFLATGDNLQSCAFAYRIGKSTDSIIIRETCEAIWYVLKNEYFKCPKAEEWKESASGYLTFWQLPNCIGAIDGKHVVIKCSPNSGSSFFNYKKTYSIVLLAVADPQYKFLYVDVGAFGSQLDSGILRHSSLGQKLFGNELDFLIGDETFPLRVDLMGPYSGKNLNHERRVFNYRLSRGRRCIENAFGKAISALPETVDSIVKASVALHNFIITREAQRFSTPRRYCQASYADRELPNDEFIPGEWRNEKLSVLQPLNTLKQRVGSRNATRDAASYRDYLCHYVNNTLQCDWQDTLVNRTHD